MLIAQAPLRISLFGGGSDLPSYLANNNGAVLSFAINQRVFIVGHPFTHRSGILLKYSRQEDVQTSQELQHPIAKVILDRYQIKNFDISIMSDVPAGTGLGSSSSFTVALLAFVRHLKGLRTNAIDLAREACEIEIELLREPIGYQDQWAASLGGLNLIRFTGQTGVEVEKLSLTAEKILMLEESLFLIPVGKPRSAGVMLKEQSEKLKSGSSEESLTSKLVAMVDEGKNALLTDLDQIGPLLHEAWMVKRDITSKISNQTLDDCYTSALDAGATGGKLLGAGGSGYLLCFVPPRNRSKFKSVFDKNLTVKISEQGAGIIHES